VDLSQATALKADFDRDGFVIIRDFATRELVREIRSRAEEATRDVVREGPFSNITKGLERRDSYFGELLHNGSHVPIVETLLGRKPQPTTASLFTKTDNNQWVHPHADAIDGAVIWIALDETDRRNGCLQFLKGSHKRRAEFAHLRAHTPTDLSDHPDRVEAAMSVGDMVIFRTNTVHWSGPNHDGSVRRGFNCFYMGDSWRKSSATLGMKDWKAAVMKKKKKMEKKQKKAESASQ
jgi:ectoine hydroxylase-related dioxygenase (phytanoyl-CoA dioxygenase family)